MRTLVWWLLWVTFNCTNQKPLGKGKYGASVWLDWMLISSTRIFWNSWLQRIIGSSRYGGLEWYLQYEGKLPLRKYDTVRNSSEDDFEKLSRLKNEEINKLEDDEKFILSRKNIFQDMINIYKNRPITKSKIHILFCDKTASGDGVIREAISVLQYLVSFVWRGKWESSFIKF